MNEAEPNCSNDETSTGLPWPKTWSGVYIFVFGTFIVWLSLLALLTGLFS